MNLLIQLDLGAGLGKAYSSIFLLNFLSLLVVCLSYLFLWIKKQNKNLVLTLAVMLLASLVPFFVSYLLFSIPRVIDHEIVLATTLLSLVAIFIYTVVTLIKLLINRHRL